MAAVVVLVAVGGAAANDRPATTAAPTSAIPAVGDLSWPVVGYQCTGTVINTPKHDIVLTAAHCIDSLGVPLKPSSFAPGYDPDSKDPTPYGSWNVKGAYRMPNRGGVFSRNPDADLALLVIAKNSQGKNIQDVVGAQDYQLNAPIGSQISAIGYPTATGNKPYYCSTGTTTHKVSGHKDEFQADCGKAYGDGVSGSAFMTNYDTTTHHGTVVAEVGGDNDGGDTSGELTYGLRLDNDFKKFLDDVLSTKG